MSGAPPARLREHASRASAKDASELESLARSVASLGPLVVAFSGGADSALLAYAATAELGRDRVHCVTADSASLPREELEQCAALASEWGLRWSTATTRELDVPAYVANGLDRCFHCKSELMDALLAVARPEGATVALGVNLDDLGDHRPGQAAAAGRGAAFPLVEAGLTKERVRALSRLLGLRTADKPAAACLASRIPHGTPVTVELLGRVARAESALRRLGFSELRIRHYGECARIELSEREIARAVELRSEVASAVRSAGYRYATLDLDGLRSGNLARAALEDAGGARHSTAAATRARAAAGRRGP